MKVKDFIEPMYNMTVSIQACNEYVERDFPNERYSINRFYCKSVPVDILKTDKLLKHVLNYNVGSATLVGDDLLVQVG